MQIEGSGSFATVSTSARSVVDVVVMVIVIVDRDIVVLAAIG